MNIIRPALYVVGTPIGNLHDISERAKYTLTEVDFIAAEDTRVTMKLLSHLEIKKPIMSYFEYNKQQQGEKILDRITARGECCALVSDAGMPAISDPGEALVAGCADRGVPVYVVPGPTALVCALAISGLPTGRFTFEGFLTMNRKNRREHLLSLTGETRTMIFYEAPHKLRRTLSDMYEVFGDRRISLVREMTKIHEEVIRTTLKKARDHYRDKEPRGEFVMIIEGAVQQRKQEMTLEEAVCIAQKFMEMDSMPPSAAAKQAVRNTGIKKSDVYRALTGLDEANLKEPNLTEG